MAEAYLLRQGATKLTRGGLGTVCTAALPYLHSGYSVNIRMASMPNQPVSIRLVDGTRLDLYFPHATSSIDIPAWVHQVLSFMRNSASLEGAIRTS